MSNLMKLSFTSLALCVLCFLNTILAKDDCPYDFKVYVYELSPELKPVKFANEARKNSTYHVCQKCIMEQFALEFVIMDFFTNFCGRTTNPVEADFFYLPIARDVEYRMNIYGSNGNNNKGGRRAPTRIDTVLIEAMEKNNMDPWKEYLNITDKWWNRYQGGDHIIVMPAPVTNLRHQAGARGYAHYMIQLHRPIFLNVEYSHSFIQEYPVCARQKNLIMPYPTIDPDLYSGKLLKPPEIKRDKLLYYHGGMHGTCVNVREALAALQRDHTISANFGGRKREQGYRQARFCPVPIGDSPSSKRMYDVMHYGCIPVVVSDDLVWAFSTTAMGNVSDALNEAQFSIRLPQRSVQMDASSLQKSMSGIDYDGPSLSYYLPRGTSLKKIFLDILKEGKKSFIEHTPKINDFVQRENDSDVDTTTVTTKTPTVAEIKSLRRNLVKGQEQRQRKEKKNKVAMLHILENIPPSEYNAMQTLVVNISHQYQYYSMSNMVKIPLQSKQLPTGGAIEHLAQFLTRRKKDNGGAAAVADACDKERHQDHNYKGSYPCQKFQDGVEVPTGNNRKNKQKQKLKVKPKPKSKVKPKTNVVSEAKRESTINVQEKIVADGKRSLKVEEAEEAIGSLGFINLYDCLQYLH